MRKFFSKEEIENWASEDWEWALQNLKEDNIEKQKFVKSIADYLKPYLNLELYKAEKEVENENKQQTFEDNKVVKEFNTDKVQFSINSNGADVFSDTIDFEEDEIPLILEE